MWKREAPRRGAPGPAAESGSAYGPWAERWLLPFVHDSTLWPVLLVVIGHAAAFLAPALLLAVRDRRLAAQAAVLILAALTVTSVWQEVRQQRRPGALNGVILCVWLLGGVLAVLADRYGVF
ncbi:MAG: hypothetical protein OEM05_00680 [Myxococcales bacterium]|nr:hypothetical protein [Myxococcales bacterium]